jgi:hypothetical protein
MRISSDFDGVRQPLSGVGAHRNPVLPIGVSVLVGVADGVAVAVGVLVGVSVAGGVQIAPVQPRPGLHV